jgi:HAD superfamily hydrolase (TIGR01509 family)
MRSFRYVIFDLDGLICDTEPLHMRAFNLVLQAAGSDYQFATEEYGRIMTGRSILENAEYARERFALAASAEDLAQAHRALFNLLVSDAANIDPMPGLDDLLNFLFEQDVEMAVASGSRREHVEKMLRALNLTSTFPVVMSADESTKSKPAPDIYIRTLRKMNANPAVTTAIEDSYSGVRAAKDAGIFVIAVTNEFTRYHDLSEANYVAANLFEVKSYLSRVG